MKALFLSLTIFVIFSFVSCEEESPTNAGPKDAYPSISSIDRTGENNKSIASYSDHLYALDFLSDSLVFYSTSYNLVLQSTVNPSSKFTIKVSGYDGAKAYDDGSLIIYSYNRDIYKVQNRANFASNITNSLDTNETHPIYLEHDSSIIYMAGINSGFTNYLIKQDMNTGTKEKLYHSNALFIIPLYTTSNREKLIFFETSLRDYSRGYFKSLSLSDYDDVDLLGGGDRTGAIFSSISNNNKIVHISSGSSILFDLNTLTETVFGGHNAKHSYISKAGNYIISAQDWSLYLYDGYGQAIKPLLGNVKDERYFHKVAFSPNSNKVLYVQSKSPDYYWIKSDKVFFDHRKMKI